MQDHARAWRVAAITALSVSTLVASAPSSNQQPSADTSQRSYQDETAALAEATTKLQSHRVHIPAPPPVVRGAPREVLETEPNKTVDVKEYARDIVLTLQALESYWSSALPTLFRQPYKPPSRIHQYIPAKGDNGHACGGVAPGPNNAMYCRLDDTIQWDGQFVLRLYQEFGDFAAALVVAHEWSHAMQARLGLLSAGTYTIQRELQADCFSGAWTRWAEDVAKILEPGDVDEAIRSLFEVRDAVGIPWFDPRAHGTGQQRIRAFNQGYDGRSPAQACTFTQ